MAKENNLSDFLSDIASAIREKKGTAEPINAQDFASEIASIETGGGMVVDAPIKDVNFYDYDGTRLYSYSWDEIVAMTELPPLPTRKGLICQEWNYTLDDIKEQSHHKADVGAIYITDDGMTRLYINTLADDTEVSFMIHQGSGQNVSGSWGDGTDIVRLGYTGDVRYSHTYAKSGAYVITISIPDNSYLSSYTDSKFGGETLRKVEIGSGVGSIRSFYKEYNLESITLSKDTDYFYSANATTLGYLSSLRTLVLPRNTTVKVGSTGGLCSYSGVRLVSMPTKIAFTSDYNTGIEYLMSGCQGIKRIVIPQGITTIAEQMFYGCTILSEVYIPNSVTSLESKAFYGCDMLKKLDFSHFTEIPSLSTYPNSPFPTETPTIVVPDALYDEWVATTGWKNYASKIVKASEQ
jgi:hypothetical protein